MGIGSRRSRQVRVIPATAVVVWLIASFARAGNSGSGQVTASLEKIEEIRRVKLAAQRDDKQSFDMNPPRLEMTFTLRPPSSTIVSNIEQPSRIKAVDSAGKDLTNIEPGFGNEKQFVSLTHVWGEPPKKFTLKLSPPARGARTFSLDATFGVWIFDELKELSFEPTRKRVEMTVEKLGNQKITAQLQEVEGSAQLTITPGTIKRYIDSIEFTDGKNTLESHGAMWNDQAVTYLFQGTPTPDMQAKVKVRAGLRKLPCRVQLTNQTLP